MFAITHDDTRTVIRFTTVTRAEFDARHAGTPNMRFVDRTEFKDKVAIGLFVQRPDLHFFDNRWVLRRKVR